MNGLLDQGWWPDGLYTAPGDAALVFDIAAAKAMGFNTLRKHVKVEPDRWYYHCDRLGCSSGRICRTAAGAIPRSPSAPPC